MAVYYARLLYNANGGSGAPSGLVQSSTTPHVLKTFTISSTKPSRTYFNFLGWGSTSGSTSASYASGGTLQLYTASEEGEYNTKTLYAVWQHQTAYVYYNANGGSGAPSTQSHWAGYSVTLSATVPTRAGYNFLGWATSASATTAQYQPNTDYQIYTTVTLYAVWQPASSKLTTANGTLGTAQTINITRYVNTYKDTITYSFGSSTGTIATMTSAGSVSWTPPLSLASQIPNTRSASCTLTCKTYNGSTLVGTTTTTITLTVPSSLTPTASVTLSDANAVSAGFGAYVQGRSMLNVEITASGQYGATIASYSSQINATTYSTASYTTGTLISSGTNSYTITVTDSRGLQTTITGTYSVTAYTAPTCQVTSLQRDETTTTTLNVSVGYSVASISNNNAKTYKIEYKLRSASSYATYTSGTLPDYAGTLNLTLTGFGADDEYDLLFSVMDSYSAEYGAGEFEAMIGSDNSLLIQSQHKAGLGFGMPSQATKQNDFRYKTVFHETVDVIPRRAYATLSSAGWYRVLHYEGRYNDDAMGGSGFIIDFNITRDFNYNNNEAHSIKLMGIYSPNLTFTNECSKSATMLVDKIRWTYNGSDAYVDIHYSGTLANNVAVCFDVKSTTDVCKRIRAESLQAVVDAPVGENVVTSYTFNANTPFIVETGTKSGWRYRKWSDGRLETWNVVSVSCTLSTIATYYHRGSATVNLPFTFTNYEAIQCNSYSSTYWMSVSATTSSSITLSIYDVVNGTQTVWISFHIIGTIS